MSEKEKKNNKKEKNDSQTNFKSEAEKERERILEILQENLINFPNYSKKQKKDQNN